MDSPIRCEKTPSTSSTLHSRLEVRNEDPALSPVFHSLFDAETVVLSPSSVSNLSLQSDVPTIVFGVDPVVMNLRVDALSARQSNGMPFAKVSMVGL